MSHAALIQILAPCQQLFLLFPVASSCLLGCPLTPPPPPPPPLLPSLRPRPLPPAGTAALMKDVYGRQILPVWPLKPVNKVSLGDFGTKRFVDTEAGAKA